MGGTSRTHGNEIYTEDLERPEGNDHFSDFFFIHGRKYAKVSLRKIV
jgi:hypothetical protein